MTEKKNAPGFTLRDLVHIGVFAALWGAGETTLGAALHVIDVPFSGLLLSSAGVAVLLVGRLFVPRPGSVLFIGLVTALLKMFSLGGIVLAPMIAIIMESLLAECVLTLGPLRRWTFMAAGAAATTWTLVHPLVVQGLLFGQGIFEMYVAVISRGARMLGLGTEVAVLVAGFLVASHLAAGAAAGLLGWDAGHLVRARLHASSRSIGSAER